MNAEQSPVTINSTSSKVNKKPKSVKVKASIIPTSYIESHVLSNILLFDLFCLRIKLALNGFPHKYYFKNKTMYFKHIFMYNAHEVSFNSFKSICIQMNTEDRRIDFHTLEFFPLNRRFPTCVRVWEWERMREREWKRENERDSVSLKCPCVFFLQYFAFINC